MRSAVLLWQKRFASYELLLVIWVLLVGLMCGFSWLLFKPEAIGFVLPSLQEICYNFQSNWIFVQFYFRAIACTMTASGKRLLATLCSCEWFDRCIPWCHVLVGSGVKFAWCMCSYVFCALSTSMQPVQALVTFNRLSTLAWYFKMQLFGKFSTKRVLH